MKNQYARIHQEECQLLYKYALNKKLRIETGTGQSTKWIAKATTETGGKFYSIDIDHTQQPQYNNVKRITGWSITYNDNIKKGDPLFTQQYK